MVLLGKTGVELNGSLDGNNIREKLNQGHISWLENWAASSQEERKTLTNTMTEYTILRALEEANSGNFRIVDAELFANYWEFDRIKLMPEAFRKIVVGSFGPVGWKISFLFPDEEKFDETLRDSQKWKKAIAKLCPDYSIKSIFQKEQAAYMVEDALIEELYEWDEHFRKHENKTAGFRCEMLQHIVDLIKDY